MALRGLYFIGKSELQKGVIRMAWRPYNPNPNGARVGDCVVRACCKATGKDWEPTFCALSLEGYMRSDMPSANHVWGAYLRRCGFVRQIVPNECPDCYTVADFCRDHPEGLFVLAISGHVVAVEDGDWWDTWDSGNEIPVYYWMRKET